jgi:hypothetical protein
VYDNINFKETKRDQVVGHKSAMIAMTTAAIVKCPELPAEGLTQDMHNPTIPLSLGDILFSPGVSGNDGGLGASITRGLIAEAVKALHPRTVRRVFSPVEGGPPTIPTIDRIELNSTPFWQLGAIYENEGTIDGAYAVHESIYSSANSRSTLPTYRVILRMTSASDYGSFMAIS